MRAAAALMVPLLVMSAGLAVARSYPDGIPGAELQRLVIAAMKDAGQTAGTVPQPRRPFPACDDVPGIAPRHEDWSQAEVTCKSPGWTRVLRLGPAAPKAAPDATPKPSEPAQTMALVLTRSLPKGATVNPDDLQPALMSDLEPDTVFTDAHLAAGRRLRTAVGVGKPLLIRHLEPDWMVTEGAPVVIRSGVSGMVVTTTGESMANGVEGDVIEVQNRASGRIVRATITARNTVTVLTNIP